MTTIERAQNALKAGDHTCVLCKGDILYTSDLRGVKPLVSWQESDADFSGFSAADKVVGKATAFLYVLLDVSSVYAGVISRSALTTLEQHGIAVEYDVLVDHIINRQGDGICPFEAAVLALDSPDEAYAAIRQKMEELHIII